MIKLLALDLDGTVLTKEKNLTSRTAKAIAQAIAGGLEVVFVTGRPFAGLPAELSVLPKTRYVITSNGAVTSDLAGETLFRTAFLDNTLTEKLLRLPRERKLLYNVFLNGFGFSEKPVYDALLLHFADTPLNTYVRQSRKYTDNIVNLIRKDDSRIENIWIRANNREERDFLNALCLQEEGLQTFLTADTDVEIGAPEADKGMALASLAKHLHIRKEEVLAIGDNENDLSMFGAAGTSVAMGNASDYVKAQASFVTASNNNDGVAAAIETFCFF